MPSHASIISRMALVQKKHLSSAGCLSCLVIPIEKYKKKNKNMNKMYKIRGKLKFRKTLRVHQRLQEAWTRTPAMWQPATTQPLVCYSKGTGSAQRTEPKIRSTKKENLIFFARPRGVFGR